MPEPARANDDEATLLERVRAGDEAAFGVLFRMYRRPLIKFAYRFLGTVARAEEIVQQVFADLWKLRQTLTLQAGLRSYLFAAVKNRSHRAWHSERLEGTWDELTREAKNLGYAPGKGQSASQQFEAIVPVAWNGGEEAVLRSELMAAFGAAINALPEPERTVVRLAKSEGMSYTDISNVLGMTHNRVRQHIVAANLKLDEYLTQAGWPGLIRRRRASRNDAAESNPSERQQRDVDDDDSKERG